MDDDLHDRPVEVVLMMVEVVVHCRTAPTLALFTKATVLRQPPCTSIDPQQLFAKKISYK